MYIGGAHNVHWSLPVYQNPSDMCIEAFLFLYQSQSDMHMEPSKYIRSIVIGGLVLAAQS